MFKTQDFWKYIMQVEWHVVKESAKSVGVAKSASTICGARPHRKL
jgi:hypothetical protein